MSETTLKERNGVKLIRSQFACGNTGNQPVLLAPRFTVVNARSPKPLYHGDDQRLAEEVFERAAES